MPMYLPKTSEPEIREIGGEPLEGSGLETEDPTTGFELHERSVEEDFVQ
jgi:hypothetical protein